MLNTTRTRITPASRAVFRVSTIRRMVTRGYVEPERPAGNSKEISFEESAGTRVFTLNRPKALNALSWDMFYTMMKKADEWREDPDVTMVIGLGEGRAFAAGGDIKSVVEHALRGENIKSLTMMGDSYRLNWKMAHLGKPYVAFMDGVTMGGGAGLALGGCVRIATPRTIYAMPEQRIGFSPDFGGSYYMSQLDGQIGTWLAVTGRDVYGREVYELGIATHYVPEEAVPEIKDRLAALENPTPEQISDIVAEYHLPGGEGLSSKTNPNGRTPITGDVRRFLDEAFTHTSLKELYTHMVGAETDESLSPEVRAWVKEQREMMDTRGPTGMAVAIENYHSAGKAKRLATTFEQDMLIATGFVGTNRSSNDIMIGVVHALFEKNKTPIPFSPSIKELDAPIFDPANIRANFFDRASPHLFDAPPMDVGDALLPPPQSVVGPDSNWGTFRRFGLPSEEHVRVAIDDARGKITSADLVERVAGHETHPARRSEFESTVWRIIADRTSQGTVMQWN
ncbi:hypothetical protein CcaverHIS002_0108430 [Cutaneotrichosporon cavernicola]|uniref:3-hydroxyisobutyryl-CoA hydrolase n=1 Tax=Cutaneotrichosporon cavernicola TaxID=279322 RepID=A0AA48L265_9TREE|nr:uncharacterized protein CcaverHIS019_0108360 [Cutaneotrichosporon cavernicola]BEI80314.1 hypothetical protein CcaverHIS002_0108430 [Cutaneotrichosporon cavernicola]BEI88118.1 hypothetical protein CcaverHIS019_0108360 [Cutaneotrichosporon cavernicola]BEI95889.1 hypothetical protein CcaverHIS631_0108380 [Cutaneotrichosporon cavernicola]BEJ03663.1 hypothetical protein CcaverHIS641_0108380 [Cutaneotrichosporon cavernicola]